MRYTTLRFYITNRVSVMKLIPEQVYWAVIAALMVLGGWTQLQLAGERTSHAVTQKNYSEATAKAYKDALAKKDEKDAALAQLDAKHTKELSDAKNKIDTLAADVRAGTRRLRIAATCPTTTSTEASNATRVDDGPGPELTPEARSDYFSLRADIETVTGQVAGLQSYVLNVCQK